MILTWAQKKKMVFQRDELPDPNSYVEHKIQEEEVFVDYPEHSPHLQTFMHDPFNQEMMKNLILANPITFLEDLIMFGARPLTDFDRTILDTPMLGDFVNKPILNTLINPQSNTSIPPNTTNPPIPRPMTFVPLSNIVQYNTSIPPVSVTPISPPPTTLQTTTSSY